MTEELLNFVRECEKETAAVFDKFLKDEDFLKNRIENIVNLTIESTKRYIELADNDASEEEIKASQKKFLKATSETQLNSLKDIHIEQAALKHERIKKLATMSLDEFKEVSFEIAKHELSLMTDFLQEIIAKAEKPMIEALNKLEEDEFDEYPESDVPIFNIDQTKTVN